MHLTLPTHLLTKCLTTSPFHVFCSCKCLSLSGVAVRIRTRDSRIIVCSRYFIIKGEGSNSCRVKTRLAPLVMIQASGASSASHCRQPPQGMVRLGGMLPVASGWASRQQMAMPIMVVAPCIRAWASATLSAQTPRFEDTFSTFAPLNIPSGVSTAAPTRNRE